jgi:uncharacterized protein
MKEGSDKKKGRDRREEGAFILNIHELPRRAGEMREYQLDIDAPFRVGVPLIAVPEGDLIELDVRCESVTEGVLITADIFAVAIGECIRCLDPVEMEVDRKIQELYRYQPTDDKGKRAHPDNHHPDNHHRGNRRRDNRNTGQEVEGDLDEVDVLYIEGDQANLEIPILDAIILSLPVNPLCDEECLGLCPDCGEKWEKLPEDHSHGGTDIRWAGLADLDLGSAEN